MEVLADRYFLEGRDYEADLINFSNYCQARYAPTTSAYYITAVKEFFIFNEVELTRKQERIKKFKEGFLPYLLVSGVMIAISLFFFRGGERDEVINV